MSGVVVVGAGPGIGRSVALRFAREGMPVALISRTLATGERLAEELRPLGVPVVPLVAECADEPALRLALKVATETLGLPDVVVYNAAVIQADTVGRLSAHGHLEAWSVNVVGALTTAAQLAPAMARRGSGSFIVTGGMPEPKRQYVSLSLGKASLRVLVDLLHLEYGAAGVHVASVTVDGPVAPGTAFDPDRIAEHYWVLHSQPREEWQREVLHTDRDLADDRR